MNNNDQFFREYTRFTLISWIVIIILIFISIVSCSPGRYFSPAKRLERFQYRHPYLFEKIQDTVPYFDTLKISIKEASLDHSILRPGINKNDTILIENDRLSTRLIFTEDSLHVSTKSKEYDTLVPIYVEIPVNRYLPYRLPRDGLRNWHWFIFGLILGAFILFVILFMTSKKQKQETGDK
mgnify:CR=1 FL=1